MNQNNMSSHSNIERSRRYLLITLSHAERRTITKEQIFERIVATFKCKSILVAKEKHKEDGFHYHVGVWNESATRYNAAKKVRNMLPEFEGRQLDLKFHKAWASVCKYVIKQDEEPMV